VISFATPQRDTTTQIGGESGQTGVGAANFNGALWVAYAGTPADQYGQANIELAWNYDGGVTYGNKILALSYGGGNPQPLHTDSNPALAVFNGILYIAYTQANFPYFVFSSDGIHWGSPSDACNNGSSATGVDASPSLTVFNGALIMANRDKSTHEMIICRIASNNTATSTLYPTITLNYNPSLAVFNNKLYAAIEKNDTAHTIDLYTSTDAVTFTENTGASSDQTSTAPSLAVHNNVLYLGFRSNDSEQGFRYKYSTNGFTFSSDINPHWTEAGPPTLLSADYLPNSPYNGQLFVYFSSHTSVPNYLCSNHGQ